MQLAETFVTWAFALWIRLFTLVVMPAAARSGLSTCLSTLVVCLVEFKCLWSQETRLFFWEGPYWNTSRFRLTMQRTRFQLMVAPGPQSSKRVPHWPPQQQWWLVSGLELWPDDWWHLGQLHLPPWVRHHQPWRVPQRNTTSTSRIHLHYQRHLTFHLIHHNNHTWTMMKIPLQCSSPSLTSCWRPWRCITTPKRFFGSEWWIASCTSMKKEWSNSGKSMQDKVISAEQWQLLAMRSPLLTSMRAGTLRRPIIDGSSSSSFARYALTLCGWHPLALCGALFRVWHHDLMNSFMLCNAKETIKNMCISSSLAVCFKSNLMKVGTQQLSNNLTVLCRGEPRLSRSFWQKVIGQDLTSARTVQNCRTSTASSPTSGSQLPCVWRALPWLKTFLVLKV